MPSCTAKRESVERCIKRFCAAGLLDCPVTRGLTRGRGGAHEDHALRGCDARGPGFGLELLPFDAAPFAHGLGPVSVGRLNRAGWPLRDVRLGGRGDLRGDGDRAGAARLFCARAWPSGFRPCACRGAALSARARAVVGVGLSGQCRAGEMGEWPGARRLDRVSCALGVGARDHRARRADWLRRAHLVHAGRHAARLMLREGAFRASSA